MMLLTIGCETATFTSDLDCSKTRQAIIASIPDFPRRNKNVLNDVVTSCGTDKCVALYEWLGDLMKFEKSLLAVKKRNITY